MEKDEKIVPSQKKKRISKREIFLSKIKCENMTKEEKKEYSEILNNKQYSDKPPFNLYEAYGVKNGERINYDVLPFDNEIRTF